LIQARFPHSQLFSALSASASVNSAFLSVPSVFLFAAWRLPFATFALKHAVGGKAYGRLSNAAASVERPSSPRATWWRRGTSSWSASFLEM
jgi:hypothetical protein